jgi:hypothetical protein
MNGCSGGCSGDDVQEEGVVTVSLRYQIPSKVILDYAILTAGGSEFLSNVVDEALEFSQSTADTNDFPYAMGDLQINFMTDTYERDLRFKSCAVGSEDDEGYNPTQPCWDDSLNTAFWCGVAGKVAQNPVDGESGRCQISAKDMGGKCPEGLSEQHHFCVNTCRKDADCPSNPLKGQAWGHNYKLIPTCSHKDRTCYWKKVNYSAESEDASGDSTESENPASPSDQQKENKTSSAKALAIGAIFLVGALLI